MDKLPANLPLLRLDSATLLVLPENSRQFVVDSEAGAAAVERSARFADHVVIMPAVDDRRKDPTGGFACLARVVQRFKLPEGGYRVILTGVQRCAVVKLADEAAAGMAMCSYALLAPKGYPPNARQEAIRRTVLTQLRRIAKHSSGVVAGDTLRNAAAIADLSSFLDYLALAVATPDDDELCSGFLEQHDVGGRAELLIDHLERLIEQHKVERKIRSRVKRQMEKTHHEFQLSEQAKAIQDELQGAAGTDIETLREKVVNAGMPEESQKRLLADIAKLANTPAASPEHSIMRGYVETVAGLPWQARTELSHDLRHAQQVLDDDHFGLAKIKDRILEYLAVQLRVGRPKGSVMCFVGPPGVGKTSLGKSIAQATGRKFVRVSLGGIHDEAAIRGHRKTYVASMPGRILKALASVGVRNPVFMLDEFDKVVSGSGMHGDPAAALLEVFDPEQNSRFIDQYVEVPFDLSEVMFITTANWVGHLPEALHDRLELIHLPGYTDQEKLEIARRHLIPKQLKEHGLKPGSIGFADGILREIIGDYTHEAGVRSLERSLAKICRKIVTEQVVAGVEPARARPAKVTRARVNELLEVPDFYRTYSLPSRDRVAYVSGLVYGQGVCPVEAVLYTAADADGKIEITGNPNGDSELTGLVEVAQSLIRKRRRALALPEDFSKDQCLHLHFQRQAASPYGPLGLSLYVLLASVHTRIPVKAATALLGEINLRGDVISGEFYSEYKAMVMDAQRMRIRRVIMPQEDAKLLADLPDELKEDMEFILVRRVEDALAHALSRQPQAAGRPSSQGAAAPRRAPGRRTH